MDINSDSIKKDIEALAPKASSYRVGFGRGLYLEVAPSGDKFWRFRYAFDGKETMMSLGQWPDGGTKGPLRKLQDARNLLDAGINPAKQRKETKNAAKIAEAMRFQTVYRKWADLNYPNGSQRHATFLNWMRDHFDPWLAQIPINKIDGSHIGECVERLIKDGHSATAHIVLGPLNRVWEYAQSRKLVQHNPVPGIKKSLPEHKTMKHPGLTNPIEVGQLLRDIDAYPARMVQVRYLMQLMPYFASRPSELREAPWTEFDLDNAMWTISWRRLKADHGRRQDLKVPIPRQALVILRKLRALADENMPYVFPNCYEQNDLGYQKCINAGTVNVAFRRMGYCTETCPKDKPCGKREHCGHGWRTTFSTLARKTTGMSYEAKEKQIAHKFTGVAGIYDEDDYIEERIVGMQKWADYLDTLRSTSNPGALPSSTNIIQFNKSASTHRAA